MTQCNFRKQEDGLWACSNTGCGYVCPIPLESAPSQNCVEQIKKPSKKQNLLGDKVERALSSVGITSKRVSKWLGRPCGCEERKEKLNQLHAWTRRVLKGKTENAEEHLKDIIN